MQFDRTIRVLVVSALVAAPAVAGTSGSQSTSQLIMVGHPGGEVSSDGSSAQLTVFGHPVGKVTDDPTHCLIIVGHPGPKAGTFGFSTPQLTMFGDHAGPKVHAGFAPSRPTVLGPGQAFGKGRKAKWVAQDGRTFIERLPLPQDPFSDDGLLVPDGTWTDVVLVLEGPVTLVGASEDGRCWAAEVDGGEWTVPLAEPVTGDGETRVYADIELPSWVMEEALDAGGWLDLDHPLHDEVWTAVQDGTLFTP